MDKLQFCLLLTGGLGLAVCLLLFSWARSVNRAVSLKSYRDGAPGFADLLNYGALIEPGILACKNGALLAAYEYAGEDHSSLSDEQRDLISDHCKFPIQSNRQSATGASFSKKSGKASRLNGRKQIVYLAIERFLKSFTCH
jgi:hypothetical protein